MEVGGRVANVVPMVREGTDLLKPVTGEPV